MLSLEKSFKTNNLEQINFLQLKEKELLLTLMQRVKVYNSYLKILNIPQGDINNALNQLKSEIKECRERLNRLKIDLNCEINHVKRITRPLGKSRDIIAERIDITT